MCRYLTVSCHPHHSGILFFIAVELDGTTVITHFSKGKANHLLLFLGDSASLLLHLVINFRAEAGHNVEFYTTKVACSHVIINSRDAPYKTLLAVGLEERAGLRTLYHGRIHHRIGFIPIPCQHLVGSVAQAFVSFLAMRACAVRKVGV